MVDVCDLRVRIQLALDVCNEFVELCVSEFMQDRSARAGKEVLTKLRELPVIATFLRDSGRIDPAEPSRFEGTQDGL